MARRLLKAFEEVIDTCVREWVRCGISSVSLHCDW